ncbi:MAG: hypothetical protein LBG68_04040, partial [Coriobacteriales bacterium]|nr:hypothetical protein [Coriobacteriales bacterium]
LPVVFLLLHLAYGFSALGGLLHGYCRPIYRSFVPSRPKPTEPKPMEPAPTQPQLAPTQPQPAPTQPQPAKPTTSQPSDKKS